LGTQTLDIYYLDTRASIPLYNVSTRNSNLFTVKIGMEQRSREQIPTSALIDSGAASSFIHPNLVKKHNLAIQKLPYKIDVFNADRSPNNAGAITHFAKVSLTIGNHKSWQALYIANIGRHSVIIGYNFLSHHNPDISWKRRTIMFSRCPKEC
jgi:hypothetical protein